MSFSHPAYSSVGEVKFTSHTTPSSSPTLCEVKKGPKYIVPVIFVPGIMGSNIIHNNGDKVWFPPNGASALIDVIKSIFRTAKDRQEQLDPLETKVSNAGDIKIKKKKLKNFSEEKARARGWGTIWWTGYGDILMYLEKHLNQEIFVETTDENTFKGGDEWKIFTKVGDATDEGKVNNLNKKWQPDSAFELLTKELHGKLADYAFPVFALGYNWLQSNEDSAKDIAARLDRDVKPQAIKEFPRAEFKKYIIVTHSMGGLVTRSLIQTKAKSQIYGVIHGVMPASGAPAVYQRLANGWDGKATTGSIVDSISALIFGHNSARLISVLGNAPGALELLPFENFRNGQGTQEWLQMETTNLNGSVITANLPQKNDPYNEIYMNRDAWWRMINENGLDPAGMLKERMEIEYHSDIFAFYEQNILHTRGFHEDISDSYHDNCYAHFGEDEKYKAFSQVKWTSDSKINVNSPHELIMFNGKNEAVAANKPYYAIKVDSVDSKIPTKNPNMAKLFQEDGKRFIKDIRSNTNVGFSIRVKATSVGDGTVCAESARDVRREREGVKLKQTYAINGYDHAGSYNNIEVQRNTLYCISKVLLNILDQSKSDEANKPETEAA